ncbi:flagellar hook-length control protein FliK, partial [Sphingomonas bacterium]|uniref:flagellar hook-length control protein FliK n=1 Tax=Sphingomonas bacterium TaxID=1895847 RepID=UPI0015758F18
PAAPFDSAQTGRIAPAIGKPVSTASYRGTRMIAPGSVDDAAKAKSGEQAAALSPDEQLKTGAIHSAAAEPDISLTQVQQPLHTAGRAAARIEGTAMIVDPGSIDAVATRHLAIARDDRWLDGLARDIAATGGADSHLRFTLAPEHLGALTVDIAQGADGASVHMTTDTDAAHAILTDAQPRLAAEARAQGLNLRETSVSTGGGQTGGDSARQPQPQSMAQSSGQQGQDRRPAPQQQAAALRQQPAFSRASDESSDRDLYA